MRPAIGQPLPDSAPITPVTDAPPRVIRRVRTRVCAVALAASLSLVGCFPFDAGEVPLDGPYFLFATDISSQMALYYRIEHDAGIGRVDETVFAAGWDAHQVIAKRHPANDRTVTEYFIIDRAKDGPYADPKETVTGPLTAAQFAVARGRFGVDPALGFRVVLHDLE